MSILINRLYRFDDFEMQPSRRALLRSGQRIPLAPKTFEVLHCLVVSAGRVVLKEEIFRAVWPDSFIEESNLTQHIFWLRKALGDRSGNIVTIPGRGYEFIAPVEVVDEDSVRSGPVQSTPLEAGAFKMEHTTERTQIVFEETSLVRTEALRRPRWQVTAALASLLFAAMALGGWGWWHFKHSPVPGDHHQVVLADLEDSTGDPDLARAMKTLLSIDLNQSPFLVVAGDNETRKVLQLMNRPKDADLTPAVAREVCERLNDQVVLAGLIARLGQKYLVTLRATDCSNGKDLVETKAVANGRDEMIKAVDAVASDMREKLGEPLRDGRTSDLALEQVHTFSLDALKAYSQGRVLHMKSNDFKGAIPFYQRAIELDPHFSSAYVQMALCYINSGQGKLADDALAKSYELREYADGLDRLYITSLYEYRKTGDRQAAIREYKSFTQLYPNKAYAWAQLGGFSMAEGDIDQGVEAQRRAVALEPSNVGGQQNLAIFEEQGGRLDDAKETIRKAMGRKIEIPEMHEVLVQIAFLQHDDDALKREMAWLQGHAPEVFAGMEDDLYLSRGQVHAAIAGELALAETARKDGNIGGANGRVASIARLELELGMADRAREHLKLMGPLSAMPRVSNALVDGLVVEAALGDAEEANRIIGKFVAERPRYSELVGIYAPEIRASGELAHGHGQEAIRALEPAIHYDVTAPNVTRMRGLAFLGARNGAGAEAEFRKVIAHAPSDVMSETVPLAFLGLAQALDMQGNHVAARQEYEAFFTLWKDAGTDIPVMRQARAEYAAIH